MPQLTAITRFPVKGLGPDQLETVGLTAGCTLPHDRRWAIENGPGPFDPDSPGHVKKKHFLMLAGQADLARLACRYDAASQTFEVTPGDNRTISVSLDDPDTHPPLFGALEALLGDAVRGPLRIVHAPGQAMTDIPEPHLSIINAASVRHLSDKTAHDLDPLRFRGNLLIDGLAPWSEFDWIGRTLRIGEARLKVQRRIRRCAATSVDLQRGVRNIDVPRALFEHYGHMDCGVYASVETGGRISCGDPVWLDGNGPTS